MDMATSVAQALASMAVAVGSLTAFAMAGCWLMTRRAPCNPYGIDGHLCCEDCADG